MPTLIGGYVDSPFMAWLVAARLRSGTDVKYNPIMGTVKHIMLRLQIVILLSVVLLLGGLEAMAKNLKNPNILMIVIDDLNDWVGAMNGHPNALTPNIDRLAEKGTLFTNAHASAPLCGPTRAALLSGLRPSSTGLYGQALYSDLKENPYTSRVALLPEYFSGHGYITLSTGKVFHGRAPAEAFDISVVQSAGYFGPFPDERMNWTSPEGDRTATDWGAFPESDEMMPDYEYAHWTAEQLQKEYEKPFFMSVGFVRPHVPLHVPQKWFDMHPLEGVMLPHHNEQQFDDMPETALRFSHQSRMPNMEYMKEGNRWKESVQAYLACITFVDHYVGLVLDALEKSPHADNTVVVLFSDHGYHVGEKGIWAKHTLWEEATRIPLIISRPEDPEPKRSHRPVNHIDIYPTLLDLAHLPPNPDNEGQSLVPLLENPEAEGFDASVTTHGFGNHAVRTDRWRYIRYEDGSEELYDHWTDPNEWTNLALRSQYANVIKELRGHLPEVNVPWDANVSRGSHYNQYMRDLFEKTRSDRED
jgi:iduronate 2-sulfatase